MDWDEASDRIWYSFCELDDESQVDIVENSAPSLVRVFETKDFDSFCKKNFNGKYEKVAQAILDGRDSYDMDFDQKWCMYDEEGELFRTGDTPADFVDNEDAFASDLMDDEDMLSQLGFSQDEIEILEQAYENE